MTEETALEEEATTDAFEAPFELFIAYLLDNTCSSIDYGLANIFSPSTHQHYRDLYRQIQSKHIRRIAETLETKRYPQKSISIPADILRTEQSAVCMGQTLARMQLQELRITQRFDETITTTHRIFDHFNQQSRLIRLRIESDLILTDDSEGDETTTNFETFLATSDSLALLELNLQRVHPQSLNRVATALRNSRNLTSVILISASWTKVHVLLQEMQLSQSITALDLIFVSDWSAVFESEGAYRHEQEAAMHQCMDIMSHNNSIKKFSITEPTGHNDATRQEFAQGLYYTALAQTLRTNTCLETIHLDGTIGQEGLDALADSLTTNETLESLTLPSDRHNTSIISFAQRLEDMTGLRVLLFGGSQIGTEQEAEAMVEGLRSNRSIWYLQFSFNTSTRTLPDRIRFYLTLNEINAYSMISYPPKLFPYILAKAGARNDSLIYFYLRERPDLLYYR